MTDSDNKYVFIIIGETLPVHIKAPDITSAEKMLREVYPNCRICKVTEEYD